MGTAVLLPQDCLRLRSQHKHQTPEMIYASECAPISRRNPLSRAQTQEAGLLPLPGQGGHTSSINIPRRAGNASHFKCRKGAEQRDIDHSSRTVSDVPVYKILQRPKQRDVAANVLAQFVVLSDVKARSVMVVEENAWIKSSQNDGVDGVGECNDCVRADFGMVDVQSDGVKHRTKGSDTKLVRIGNKGGSVNEVKDMSTFVNGVRTSIFEGYKLSSAKVGAAKPKNALNDAARGVPPRMVSKSFVTKASGKVTNVSCKAVVVLDSEEPRNLPRLRRTATEPQIISTHTLGQCKSKVIHASFQKSKSESHARGLFVNTSALSCQERWAGPAYTSSPPPSSLPLPKLCLPQTRSSSLEIPLLGKQYSSSVYMQPFLGSSSAPSEKGGGAWDVAFATKSLRKMLNLDPC